MNDKIRKLIESIVPFMLLGVAISLIIGLFIMFSYVLVWGIFIGGIFWLGSLAKNYFFPNENASPTKKQGRIIEHDSKK